MKPKREPMYVQSVNYIIFMFLNGEFDLNRSPNIKTINIIVLPEICHLMFGKFVFYLKIPSSYIFSFFCVAFLFEITYIMLDTL